MASLHDIMAEPAVAALMTQFGQLGPDGFKKLKYFDPSKPGADPYKWPYIKYPLRFELLPDEQGGIVRKEVMTVDVLTDEVLAAGITRPQHEATVEIDGEPWTVDAASTTGWSGPFVTFGLTREPLVRRNERQHGAV